MNYRVIHFFNDLQDGNFPYTVGDKYPRSGIAVNNARILELSGKDNKQGKALIEEVVEDKQYTKSEINRLSTAELKALAKESGIADAEELNGGELKKILIEQFGL